jgi:hypothetical protein
MLHVKAGLTFISMLPSLSTDLFLTKPSVHNLVYSYKIPDLHLQMREFALSIYRGINRNQE